MSRPVHPIIQRIRARDAALATARAQNGTGPHPGEWNVFEAADVLGCGKSAVYNLIESGQVECTSLNSLGSDRRNNNRLTSNGLIAFVERNTSGPDEVANLTNLQETLKGISAEGLALLSQWMQKRMAKLKASEAWQEPMKPKSLEAALKRAEAGTTADALSAHPDLFAVAAMTNAE